MYTLCKLVYNTSPDVVSTRVLRELKEKMKRYKVGWSKEIRVFIEECVKVFELLELLNSIEKDAEKRKTRVDSAVLIRESREES